MEIRTFRTFTFCPIYHDIWRYFVISWAISDMSVLPVDHAGAGGVKIICGTGAVGRRKLPAGIKIFGKCLT